MINSDDIGYTEVIGYHPIALSSLIIGVLVGISVIKIIKLCFFAASFSKVKLDEYSNRHFNNLHRVIILIIFGLPCIASVFTHEYIWALAFLTFLILVW